MLLVNVGYLGPYGLNVFFISNLTDNCSDQSLFYTDNDAVNL